MVNYSCPRCGFTTNIKTKYVSHLRRKYICKNTLSDDNLKNEYTKYNIEEKINIPKKSSKNTQYPKKHPQKILIISSKNTHNNDKISNENNSSEYICEFCNKKLSSYKNLWRHLKTCKEKIKDDECKQNMTELVKLLNVELQQCKKELEKRDLELEKRNNQIDELIKKTGINIGTQNNIQNNIQILAYNNSDISHLTDKDYVKCLKHSNFCIPHLIKQIHFNPKKPENHNIYISNLKNNYVMIYNGNKWILNDRDESIQNLIDDKESIMEQKIEEWIENGNQYPDIMKKFRKYIDKKENDVVLNKIKGEIKLMLFNNRDIIVNN